jgi:hypothetical protein
MLERVTSLSIQGWIAGASRPQRWFPAREVRHGNLHSPGDRGPVQKGLAELRTDTERDVRVKLLTDEEAKERIAARRTGKII